MWINVLISADRIADMYDHWNHFFDPHFFACNRAEVSQYIENFNQYWNVDNPHLQPNPSAIAFRDVLQLSLDQFKNTKN